MQWLEYQYLLRRYSVEFYIVVLSTLFTLLGIWLGIKINSPQQQTEFKSNAANLTALNISKREFEVLTLLAAGSNSKEIGAQLHISVNTVKTHLQNLYEKLEASHRGQAVASARKLGLVP